MSLNWRAGARGFLLEGANQANKWQEDLRTRGQMDKRAALAEAAQLKGHEQSLERQETLFRLKEDAKDSKTAFDEQGISISIAEEKRRKKAGEKIYSAAEAGIIQAKAKATAVVAAENQAMQSNIEYGWQSLVLEGKVDPNDEEEKAAYITDNVIRERRAKGKEELDPEDHSRIFKDSLAYGKAIAASDTYEDDAEKWEGEYASKEVIDGKPNPLYNMKFWEYKTMMKRAELFALADTSIEKGRGARDDAWLYGRPKAEKERTNKLLDDVSEFLVDGKWDDDKLKTFIQGKNLPNTEKGQTVDSVAARIKEDHLKRENWKTPFTSTGAEEELGAGPAGSFMEAVPKADKSMAEVVEETELPKGITEGGLIEEDGVYNPYKSKYAGGGFGGTGKETMERQESLLDIGSALLNPINAVVDKAVSYGTDFIGEKGGKFIDNIKENYQRQKASRDERGGTIDLLNTEQPYEQSMLNPKTEETNMKLEQQYPEAMMPKGAGEDTVDTTIEAVENVLGKTNGYMKDIALVESDYGENKETYTSDNGSQGIFQVSPVGLEATQDTKSHPKLKAQYAKIQEAFGINWEEVTMEQMQYPLYNAIAARLYLLNDPNPIPVSREERAQHWAKFYNTDADEAGTPEYFLSKFEA